MPMTMGTDSAEYLTAFRQFLGKGSLIGKKTYEQTC